MDFFWLLSDFYGNLTTIARQGHDLERTLPSSDGNSCGSNQMVAGGAVRDQPPSLSDNGPNIAGRGLFL